MCNRHYRFENHSGGRGDPAQSGDGRGWHRSPVVHPGMVAAPYTRRAEIIAGHYRRPRYTKGGTMYQTRRHALFIACLCVCIGLVAAVVWFFFFTHLTLHVATGPVGSDGQKFLAAFVRSVADAHPRVRLQVVPMADREASAKALTAGEAARAVVRSDDLTRTADHNIAIRRRYIA